MRLEIERLAVSYGAVEILEPLGFALDSGAMTALIGPNGAGKSSLLKAIAGLLKAPGSVRLDGEPLPGPRERGKTIAYMPQDLGPTSSLTALEVVLLGRVHSLGLLVSSQLRAQAESMLDAFGLLPLQGRSLDALSGGQRQLVYLAQALFREPRVLLLDEPTAALDLRHQLIVLEAVTRHCRDHDIVAVAAMHDLTLAARFAPRLLCLSQGRLAADGAPDEVLSGRRLREIYGVEAEISTTPTGALSVAPLRAIGAPIEIG